MSRVVVTILLLFFSLSGFSQHLGSTDWVTEEDFRVDEAIIVENILWLEENPFATESNDTKAISQYVLDWLTETPYVYVTLDEIFTERIINNKRYKYGDKFLVTYLFGKSAYIIQNPGDKSEVNASTRGVVGMVKVYDELLKVDLKAYNRTLELYRGLYEDGVLEDYVREQLESRGMGS